MSDPYVRYDYAWNTPGFTAQNPVITSPGPDSPTSLPADISLVRLYGSWLELDTGRPLEGVLRLRVNKILTHVPTGQQVMGGALKPIRFKKDGFSIYLPATDDPQLTPAFLYQARLTVRGQTQEFEFSLPSLTPEVNITTKIPAV